MIGVYERIILKKKELWHNVRQILIQRLYSYFELKVTLI